MFLVSPIALDPTYNTALRLVDELHISVCHRSLKDYPSYASCVSVKPSQSINGLESKQKIL